LFENARGLTVRYSSTFSCFVAACCLLGTGAFAQAPKPHVLVISIDAMKPEYITRTDEHGLKVPNLRKFLTDGSYAEGVVGVVPTVTFPSHITLITGVWPAEHGIVANALFDPLGGQAGSYWYFRQIHAETLYQAADAAGLTTASVGWPVTLGAPEDYLIAGYGEPAKSASPEDQPLHPADIKQQLGVQFATGSDDDDHRAGWAKGIIRKWNPNLLLLHFNDLDKSEHAHGPFSVEADAAMEHMDRLAGEAIAAELAMSPDAVVIVLSDHGFARVEHEVNLNAFFVQAGLITLKPARTDGGHASIAAWDAECRLEDGSAAVVLRDPEDKALLAKVRGVLQAMKSDPANGIDRVLDADELHRRGGFPDASFLIDLKPGWATRGGLRPPFVVETPGIGTHGYLPDHPEMRSSFFVAGRGVAKGKDFGVIDMRQIAPTIAEMLHVRLPAATMKPLAYAAK
jgi:predicted AlkP superfamily pyrophosphatase or phosphodiesterase